jgi:HSP20 family protein
MELVPWKPFGELSSLRSEMDRLWDRFLGDRSFTGMFSDQWAPSIDISETKDNVIVKADLPGIDIKDVEVTITGNVLSIKGEKAKEKESKEEHSYRSERYRGSFQRSLSLPVDVKAEKAEAAFDKGVLKVTLPKAEASKSKQIKIQNK